MSKISEILAEHRVEIQAGKVSSLPRNIHQVAQLRYATKERVEALLNGAVGRDLNSEESAEYDTATAVLRAAAERIDAHAGLTGRAYGAQPNFRLDGRASSEPNASRTAPQITPQIGHSQFRFSGLSEYIRDTGTGIRASLSDGGDLVHILPGHEVMNFVTAYPATDPYGLAQANVTELDGGWVDGAVPIVAAGTDPSVYAEGAGPTSDESAKVYALELKTPKKIAFLTLPTEEAISDLEALASTIGTEGIRRLLNGLTRRVTSDLVYSLVSAGATVTGATDNYDSVLSLINAIPPAFSSSRLVFMGNRQTRAKLYNTRASGTGAPLFSPDLKQLLGYDYVVNDTLSNQRLLFGSFGDGVFIRKAGIFAQRMDEAYRESGKIGFRFYQRSDWGFFASAATASQVEQPVYMLSALDFGS